MTAIVISADAALLVEVARKALAHQDLPGSALIGGLAVAVRVAAPNTSYRATADIDIVTDDAEPTLMEILTSRHDTHEPIVIDGIKVDIIATMPVSGDDLAGIDDGPRLFVAGHRWALDTAEAVTITTTTASTQPLTIRVATPAALVAAKAHAVGFARSQRRSTKRGSDLLDVFRLVQLRGDDGRLAATVHTAPGRLAPIIAEVIRSAFLANPTKAAAVMGTPTATIEPEEIEDLMTAFVADLDAAWP